MAKAESTARAVWQGDLMSGSGAVSTETGVLRDQRITWAARVERVTDTTSPEELLAAAHAACYAMAFSHHLAGKDMPPERLTVSATYTFVPGTGITEAQLDVSGSVPGLSAEEFAAEAKEGESKCPVSNAVRGNVEITLEASPA
jgi:lipoyl-dependent peroxiredoxin